MPIYADPTELRSNTRLPAAVVSQCAPLPGLEAVTGGDFLVTTKKIVAPEGLTFLQGMTSGELGSTPGETASKHSWALPMALTAHSFTEACEQGLLVQRKTGRDLASSVPKLSNVLTKMLGWTTRPWLLFVGALCCNKAGEAIIDGAPTHFTHNAVQGALEAWQVRGGYVTALSRDSLVAGWIARWLDKLRAADAKTKEVILPPRSIRQPIVGPASGDDNRPWRGTLMSFPDMGVELANRVAEGNSTLAGCLEWISCPDWLDKKSLSRPKGIGVPTIRKWRHWMGLDEDWLQLLIAAVPDGTKPKVVFTHQTGE